jgi:hypothetical protein
MLKVLIISLVLISAASNNLIAQTASKDSLIKIAQADVKYFKLNSEDFTIFRKNKGNYTSDFFKPKVGAVSDTLLLKDSVYVKAYRQAAYNKSLKKRTVGHYMLVGGAVYVGVTVVVAIVALFIVLSKLG